MKRYILLLIILYQVSLAPEERKFHKNDITLGLITVLVENNVGIGGFSDRQYILNSGIEAGFFLSERFQLAGRLFIPYKANSVENAGYSLEPYTLKTNMGEMSEAILRYYFPIRKKSEENKTFSILPYLGVSAGYLNSIEYKFLRNLPDGTVVTNSCFFCSPNSSLLELFGPIADSYTVFIPKRNFIGINAGITFLFESFFWGIEISSNSHQKKMLKFYIILNICIIPKQLLFLLKSFIINSFY
ncbi:MAG TPA: hypothetical protein PKV80_28055 [Leptospiraceae bacterium]|nr:hypothetical protein [Leptospiraceae bacterium]